MKQNLISFLLASGIISSIQSLTNRAEATGAAGTPAQAKGLVADTPLILPGPPGSFDFMTFDPVGQRILAAHKGAGSVQIVDLTDKNKNKAVAVGDAQGVAVDINGRRYFLGNDTKKSVVVLDASTLTKISEVSVDGPVDAIAYDSANGRVYAAKDDGDLLWVIDPKTSKLVTKISIPGVPEVLEYDSKTDRVYLNIKDKNLVVRINPTTNQVEAKWPTTPVDSPHGLVLDSTRGLIFTAGKNGKLASMKMDTGKVVSVVDIAPGVDQIAFDPETRTIYSACKGFLSASRDTKEGLQTLSQTPSPAGAHTLAIDLKTHEVWVSYADKDHSYMQRFR